jgi:precorrin-2/cobalt-factor-2 C20-methyltransferase
MTGTGTAFGLGVGPGDPELVTLKALKILNQSPVLAYPAPEKGAAMAREIVAPHVNGGNVEIPIRMPLQADRFPVGEIYDAAARDIGGHPVEVVPGVSSLTACAAVLAEPLVALNDVLSVVPATLAEDELAARIEAADAVAVVKVGRHFAKLNRVLDRLGLSGRARYVERATMESQRILPLGKVNPEDVPYFSMVLVPNGNEKWREAAQ